MEEDVIISEKVTEQLKKVSAFVDYTTMSRIINKLTDYAEPISEGKLAGIINFNYSLNSSQANMIIDLLLDIQAISKIYAIAQKGKKDLDVEYISNIFSDSNNPGNISSYLSLRTLLENRLNHQVQQYNMNMNKSNTTLAIPINELKGHVKTYNDLSESNVTMSHKAQHGYVAASLHDAYVIIMNRIDWWDDRTYMKYFFNEDEPSKRNITLLGKVERLTLQEINRNVKEVLAYFQSISLLKTKSRQSDDYIETPALEKRSDESSQKFSDRLMLTPFGRQYGARIDATINEIFASQDAPLNEEEIKKIVSSLFQIYKTLPGAFSMQNNLDNCVKLVNYLLSQDFGLKKFMELFLYSDKKIPFSKFFAENKEEADEFLTKIFVVYFEYKFSSIFRIIKSLDMKQYACAFIIKRIYIIKGEDLPTFGYFLIKGIARYGKIKAF